MSTTRRRISPAISAAAVLAMATVSDWSGDRFSVDVQQPRRKKDPFADKARIDAAEAKRERRRLRNLKSNTASTSREG